MRGLTACQHKVFSLYKPMFIHVDIIMYSGSAKAIIKIYALLNLSFKTNFKETKIYFPFSEIGFEKGGYLIGTN